MHCSAKPCAHGDGCDTLRPKPLSPTECLTGANPLPPDLMTADQRLTEIGTILTAGLLRLRRKQSERHGSHLEKKSVDFSPERSVHATARQRRRGEG
jgi:hypothetical protein